MDASDAVLVRGADYSSAAEDLMLNLTKILECAKFDLDSEREHALNFVSTFSSFIRPTKADPNAPAAPRASGGLARWQVQRLQAHIETHFEQKISVGELSDYVQLSPSHFARAFKQTFGESPHNYIIRRRVKSAKQLLVSTVMPLTEIALRCGFFDQAHLSRTFRQIIGETPSIWRRHQRQSGSLGPNQQDHRS